MSKVVMISVAAAVGLGLLSLHLVNRLRENQATIADLRQQLSTLKDEQQRQPAPPPRENNPPPEVIAPQPSEVIGTPPKAPPKTVGVVTASGQSMPSGPLNREDRMRMFREHRERQRQLMQDPEYRDAMRVQTRGNFARQYPGVIEELGLDSQQADEFFDLLADQQMRANEQMQPIWEMDSADPADLAALQERQSKIARQAADNQRKNEEELAARFGQDKLQAWKEYQSTMGMRYELENMRNTLASSGIPLSDDVSKPMLKALAQANRIEASEHMAAVARVGGPVSGRLVASNDFDAGAMERQLEFMKKRNQRMLEAISPYLSFEQRQAIEKQQEAQIKMQEAQYRLIRAQGKGDQNNTNGVYFVEGSSNLTPLRP